MSSSKPLAAVAALAAVALLGACGRSGSRGGLEYGSASEVERFLAAGGVKAKLGACDNIRTGGAVTRGLSCTTTLSAADVTALAGAYALARAPGRPRAPSETGHCDQRPGFAATDPGVDVWSAHWGCGPPHRSFGYLVVHHVAATGAACV